MSITRPQAVAKRHDSGYTLIELIIAMIVIGIALAGIFSAINYSIQHSGDPVVKKQALAVAEALLEEIELMPFTLCDPNDPAAPTATTTANCTYVEMLGPETIGGQTETRYSATVPFDNVNDYNGFSMASGAIMDITNTNLGLSGYAASVTVVNHALNGIGATNASLTPSTALLITVTVTGPMSTTVQLQSYRSQYAPDNN